MVSSSDSVRKKVTKGCPQGSILGPSCWNLIFDEVLQLLSNTGLCEPIAYADDLLVIVYGNSRRELQQKGQSAALVISEWCATQKLTLSAAKTEMILLKGSLDIERPPVIKIYGKNVALKPTIKWLGVHIDQGMGINSHIENICAKAERTFYTLARLARADWGLRHQTLRTLYTGLFVPIIAYAAAGWADLLDVKKSSKLLGSQRRILISTTKAYRTVSTHAITVIAGEIPIDLVIAERASSYKVRKAMSFEIGECRISHAELASGDLTVTSARARVRREILAMWQSRWSASTKGRITFRFFEDVRDRQETRWLIIDHYTVQFLSGHGDFRAKLEEFNLAEDGVCACGGYETSTHVLFNCPKHDEARELLKQAVETSGQHWPVAEAGLVSNANLSREFRNFAKTVLTAKSRTQNAV